VSLNSAGGSGAFAGGAIPPQTAGLERLGWDTGWDEAFAPSAARGLQAARVVAVDRSAVTIISADERGGAADADRATFGADLLADIAADSSAGPCAGDWIGIRRWPDRRTTVDTVLPRRTAFVRSSSGKDLLPQVLAANIDIVLIAVSLAGDVNPAKAERFLTLSWSSGAQPVLLLTKADLATDAETIAAEFSVLSPGVPVLTVSAETRQGFDELIGQIAGRTSALIGSSGVGKSTLVNALVSGAAAADAPLRVDQIGANGKGRHTTVRRELIPLPGGGAIIDTPGLRGIGLTDAESGIDRVFPEIDALAAECRFADCAHEHEPDCAVLDAVGSGVLSIRRLESYRKLQREAAWMARRGDARARAEARRRWAAITAGVRRSERTRP
jgi:ribosome biogenesis GTPase / thiamine phosphate phosphatase